jgi:hypothetical protein
VPHGATPTLLPLLTPLDAATFGIAAVVATILAILRPLHGIKAGKGQWLADATGVWTVAILLMIALSTFTRQLPFLPNVQVPSESDLIKNNGILIPFAFTYCALMISNNIIESIWIRWSGFIIVSAKKFSWLRRTSAAE